MVRSRSVFGGSFQVAILVAGFIAASCGCSKAASPAPGTFAIEGTVAGAPDATVTLSGNATATTTVDASGKYTFADLGKGHYTVTPSAPGYRFEPATLAVNLDGADATGQNFTATPAFSITGTITGAGSNAVTVNLTGPKAASTTTDSNGKYTFANLPSGTYTLTPSLIGFTFDPTSASVAIGSADVSGKDFAAAAAGHALTGRILGAIAQGVVVTLSGDLTATTVTASDGTYLFGNVPNGHYTLTPTLTGYVFTPPQQAFAIDGGDENWDFTSNVAPKYTISGASTGHAGIITFTLSGAQTGTVRAIWNGTYAFENLANGGYVVTPSLDGYTFKPASKAVTLSGADATAFFDAWFVARPVPDTGLTTCYGAGQVATACTGLGEDAEYSIHPRSYQDLGGGVVRDNLTQLLWQAQDDGATRNWSDAVDYCANLVLGGHTGWRLPEVHELVGIADFGHALPAISAPFSAAPDDYWSRTRLAGSTNDVWMVNFAPSVEMWHFTGLQSTGLARCVIGPRPPPFSRYIDNADGTVTDSSTNLIWKKDPEAMMKPWSEALPLCEGLTFAGYSDWRAPTVSELAWLIWWEASQPSLDPVFGDQADGYWSSTSYVGVPGDAFTITVGLGVGRGSAKGSPGSLSGTKMRCVRGQ